MKKFTSFLESSAPIVLRIGMSAVILWFSSQQFLHADVWTAYVPDSAVAFAHVSATTLVYFNATFELFFGLALLFGYKTRLVALLLSLHLFDIMYVVGYGEIGVRDFGLAVATLVVSMNGSDPFCLSYKKRDIQVAEMQPVSMPTQPNIPRKLI
jgi:uncharacterized membrane protein YphA (DoxX/SURF4 family)